MKRTTTQEQTLDNVIDWLQKGAPHVTLKDGNLVSGFDYSTYASPDYKLKDNTGRCGTVACIAGAVRLFKTQSLSRSVKGRGAMSTEYFAAMALGLKSDEAEMLFYPFELKKISVEKYYASNGYTAPLEKLDLGFDEEDFQGIILDCGFEHFLGQTILASPQQVARVLLNFKNTGFIDWFILEA
jgi:hypothetical protein